MYRLVGIGISRLWVRIAGIVQGLGHVDQLEGGAAPEALAFEQAIHRAPRRLRGLDVEPDLEIRDLASVVAAALNAPPEKG